MYKEKRVKENKPKKVDNSSKSFGVKEIVWLTIGLLVAVDAIIWLILGLICDYADLSYNIFDAPNSGMKSALYGLDFKWFGVITLVLGALICSLSLSAANKNDDREKEKEARRQQRLKAMEEAKNQGVVVDFTESTTANKD